MVNYEVRTMIKVTSVADELPVGGPYSGTPTLEWEAHLSEFNQNLLKFN
jgi:hypothetical protein